MFSDEELDNEENNEDETDEKQETAFKRNLEKTPEKIR